MWHALLGTILDIKAFIDCFLQGPALFTWYTMLDTAVKGTGALKVLKMVLIDQVWYGKQEQPRFLYLFIY